MVPSAGEHPALKALCALGRRRTPRRGCCFMNTDAITRCRSPVTASHVSVQAHKKTELGA
jgi:hypothetical protein